MFTCTESQNPSLMAQFVNRHVLEQMTFRVLQTYYISDWFEVINNMWVSGGLQMTPKYGHYRCSELRHSFVTFVD